MKVLNYLEFNIRFAKQDIFSYEYRDFLLHKLKIKGFEDFMGFYCQSFKPELITELFDGWEKEEERQTPFGYVYDYVAANTLIHIRMITDYRGRRPTMIRYYSESNAGFYFPRTLDDFITDCQRAGIELEWSS